MAIRIPAGSDNGGLIGRGCYPGPRQPRPLSLPSTAVQRRRVLGPEAFLQLGRRGQAPAASFIGQRRRSGRRWLMRERGFFPGSSVDPTERGAGSNSRVPSSFLQPR